MSAGTAVIGALPRLRRTCAFGNGWGEFLGWVGDRAAPDSDPWLMHPFGVYGPAALPAHNGPVVYASVDQAGRCRYVGKSLDVVARFRSHVTTDSRQNRWDYVVVCRFGPIEEGFLDRAEAIAAMVLRPLEGTRHPRLR